MDRHITVEAITYLPEHVAIIMDGNGRWAERRNLPRLKSHQVGVKAVRSIEVFTESRGGLTTIDSE